MNRELGLWLKEATSQEPEGTRTRGCLPEAFNACVERPAAAADPAMRML
jgi:hypothetical protein